jgi:hypothetical protein
MGFNPYPANPNPCWHCHWFKGMVYQNTAAECGNPKCSKIRSQPENGCASFEREPGADDEADRPLLCDKRL